VNSQTTSHQVKLYIGDEEQTLSPCSAFPLRFRVAGSALQNGLPVIAAATSVAMSFIAHERKVSFECCRPYKPASRLSLARFRHFAWAPDPDVMLSSGG